MKKDIHPKYNEKITVTCVCGNKFTTGSTESAISIEVCADCHPFYTGKQKFLGVAGRVDKFRKRMEATKNEQGKTTKKSRQPKSEDSTVKLG